jgi:Antibiotic biosynthesis monooxygenase
VQSSNWRFFNRRYTLISITVDPSVFTVIHAYEVSPEHQKELAAKLVEAIELFGHSMAGHISSNVHLSKDGKRVTSYSQWDAQESKALFDDPAVLNQTLGQFAPYIGHATGQDFAMYDVFFSKRYK